MRLTAIGLSLSCPVMAGIGPVEEQGGVGAFGGCPTASPATMTIDSIGDTRDIDESDSGHLTA